jgi:hypothetical protein
LSPFTAAKATFALNAAVWFRLVRFVIVSPVQRHHRRGQAETPLITLSRFPRPALSDQGADFQQLQADSVDGGVGQDGVLESDAAKGLHEDVGHG